jgi:hypothetical protein
MVERKRRGGRIAGPFVVHRGACVLSRAMKVQRKVLGVRVGPRGQLLAQAQVHGAKPAGAKPSHRLADLVVITHDTRPSHAACGTRKTLEEQSVDGFGVAVGGVDRDSAASGPATASTSSKARALRENGRAASQLVGA